MNMTLVRAAATGILVIVILATGGLWADASAARLGWSTPSAPRDRGDGDSALQLGSSAGVLGQGDGSINTQSLSQTEARAGAEASSAVVASSRRVSTDAYLETYGASLGDSIFGYTSVASSSRRFTPDGYVETAGVAGATSSNLAGSIFGYTSVLKFNNAGLYSAAFTMTGPPGPVGPAQEDTPLPSTLVLLSTALGVVVGAHAIRRRRLEASA